MKDLNLFSTFVFAMNRNCLIGFRCAPMERVRIGFIGVGARGVRAVERMANIEGTEIVGVCDFIEFNLENASAITAKYSGNKPATYLGEDSWRTLCERDDIDLIYISTDWVSHAEIAIHALECGKHTAIEVPAAMSVADCWRLVDAAEKAQRH